MRRKQRLPEPKSPIPESPFVKVTRCCLLAPRSVLEANESRFHRAWEDCTRHSQSRTAGASEGRGGNGSSGSFGLGWCPVNLRSHLPFTGQGCGRPRDSEHIRAYEGDSHCFPRLGVSSSELQCRSETRLEISAFQRYCPKQQGRGSAQRNDAKGF